MRLSLNRLRRGASAEDRRDFAECFNATLEQLGIKPGEAFVIATAEQDSAPRAGHCRFCRRKIDPDRAWKRESGYTKPRSQGGTNALAIKREHFDDLACDRCIANLKRGIAPTQESLDTGAETATRAVDTSTLDVAQQT